MFPGNRRKRREIMPIAVQHAGVEKNMTCKNRWNRRHGDARAT
jgi:hypothetical protein